MRLKKKRIFKIFICLIIFCSACSDLENPLSVSISEIIKLSRTDSGELRADNFSTTTFLAEILKEASDKAVTFKTNIGSFLGTSNEKQIIVKADMEGKAEATLRVGSKVDIMAVSASISDFVVTEKIELLRAHAEKIVGETSSYTVTRDGARKAVLKAILTRSQGMVSEETRVVFQATQLDDQNNSISVGRFLDLENAKTNSNGVAWITFTADTGDVIAGKPVTIRMVTEKDDGSQLEFKLELQVQ